MIGLLSAIPKKPLYERLKASNRLDEKDSQTFQTNILPLTMSRDRLSEGYIDLVRNTYEPEVFFERVDDLYIRHRYYENSDRVRNRHMSSLKRFKRRALAIVYSVLFFSQFLFKFDNSKLRN